LFIIVIVIIIIIIIIIRLRSQQRTVALPISLNHQRLSMHWASILRTQVKVKVKV